MKFYCNILYTNHAQLFVAISHKEEMKEVLITHPNLHIVIRLRSINDVFPGIDILHNAYRGR